MPKILFVDDEVGFLNSANRHFRKSDYEIVTAENGHSALQLLAKADFDLVVLDQMMPEMDGMTVFEEIRKLNSALPVIMCSGHGTIQLAVEFMKEKSAVYFLPKPLDFMVLDLKIRDVLRVVENENKLRRVEIGNAMLKQNLKALRTLAGGIAHNFNNALTVVTGNAELLSMALPDHESVTKCIESVKTPLQRMTNLINHLLAYSQQGKYNPKVISFHSFLDNTLPLILYNIDPAIRVDVDLTGAIGNIRADLMQMQMVVSAMVTNAVEAIEGSGSIRISVGSEELDKESAESRGVKGGHYVCVTLEDDGKGMGTETMERMFDPFFTTKFQGRGLGMSAAHGIISNHNGWISVDSELGKGTRVDIYLPAADVQAEEG